MSSVINRQRGAGGARVRCATRSRRGFAPPSAPAALLPARLAQEELLGLDAHGNQHRRDRGIGPTTQRSSPTARSRFGFYGAITYRINTSTRRFRPATVVGQQDGTTANERVRTMASAATAERLGPLIRNQETTMGYYHLPVRCLCEKHEHQPDLDPGFTHHPDDACPFAGVGTPWHVDHCCWFSCDRARVSLILNGYRRLADRMTEDMSCDEAAVFASELRSAVDRLEKSWGGLALCDERRDFEEALDAILEAALWHERTAGLGFGAFSLEG